MCEILGKNNTVLGIVSRKEAREHKYKLKAALTMVTNSKGEYFLAKRSPNKKIFPGLWALGAGGAVTAGESFKEAAKRELFEELGVKALPKYLFDFEYTDYFGSYYAKVFLAKWDKKITLQKEEYTQGKWLSEKEVLEIAKEKKLAPDTKLFFEKYLKESNYQKNR
jgi:8-oxo-dGTP pyrophosphatase MutT (NUDIX family)